MATSYLTPGVYVEEVPSANKPIEGVGTSIAAFVGPGPGRAGQPADADLELDAVRDDLRRHAEPRERPLHGGRLPRAQPSTASSRTAAASAGSCASGRRGRRPRRPRCRPPATRASRPSAPSRSTASTRDVKLELDGRGPAAGDEGDDAPPTYKLMVTRRRRRARSSTASALKKGRAYIVTKVNAASKLDQARGDRRRAARRRARHRQLHAVDAEAVEPTSSRRREFEGDVAKREGMGGLAAVDEVTMVGLPRRDGVRRNGDDTRAPRPAGQDDRPLREHGRPDGDPRRAARPASRRTSLEWRMNSAGYDSKFATLYYPWLEVMDPITKRPLLVPPSGHVAGVWARTDATRGVHKAPANEVMLGVNGLAFQITRRGAGRPQPARASTASAPSPAAASASGAPARMSSDPEWRYVNVRRLFNYISESIMEGTQWAVFEPNDERLWSSLRISTSNFLTRTWRAGRAVRRHARARRSSSSATPRPTRRT